MKVGEPATDLAIALATASALMRTPLPPKTIVLGEVGLAGEIRPVPNIDRRLAEAKRLGYTSAIIPAGTVKTTGIAIKKVRDIQEALDAAF
ncbi:DNA repair protein RadA [Corynebacterium pseudotuberculosis]|nr:DNA repair protein RadA [Corynebacterium pseudotuberculosis]AIG09438.1 DNA repair protein RadA [Corynebacterium pseudotuberculosis]